MLKDNYLKLQLKSIGENVALSRVVVSSLIAQVDTTLDYLEDIKVAVSEAVSNSIIHGYQEREDQLVTLEIEIKEGQLTIIVEDQGIGIEDVEQAMEPAFSTSSERMGLGFVFMQSFMDELLVDSKVNEGTKVTMRKNLAAMEDSISDAI